MLSSISFNVQIFLINSLYLIIPHHFLPSSLCFILHVVPSNLLQTYHYLYALHWSSISSVNPTLQYFELLHLSYDVYLFNSKVHKFCVIQTNLRHSFSWFLFIYNYSHFLESSPGISLSILISTGLKLYPSLYLAIL